MSVQRPDVAVAPTPANAEPTRLARGIAIAAVIVGGALIAATLHVQRGSTGFYVSGYLLAGVWFIAAAASRSVRVHGTVPLRNELLLGVLGGGVTFGFFVAGAVIGRHVSFLAGPIDDLLGKADAGSVVAVLALALVNGVAEELFYRGSLVDAIGGRWALYGATAVYVGVTALGANTALTLAALVMGAAFAFLRGRTHGLVAPIVTHLVWSTLIILALPR